MAADRYKTTLAFWLVFVGIGLIAAGVAGLGGAISAGLGTFYVLVGGWLGG